MPFVSEDGNGREDAVSYASVQAFKDFAAYRFGVTVPDDDTQTEKALATATAWIDTNFENAFVGSRIFANQALAFPRDGFIGPDGMVRPLGWMPSQIVKATCILAVEVLKGDPLYKNADGAARQVIEDSVGPLITKYAPTNPALVTVERSFPEVRQTLAPLLRAFRNLTVCRA